MKTCCSPAIHEALKTDPAAWAALALKGVLQLDEEDPSDALELRNCECGSTLARPLAEVERERST